ncbi:MAG: PPC domain-containing protein, partial [Nitrospiraceae bacterium]
TGNGFTSATLVQFDAQDDQGVNGTLTRTGTANATGTQLTVLVPELARTGTVRVVGSPTTLALQIVPTLRAVSGAITPGAQVMLEGTGLVEGSLTITIDGQLVTTKDVRNIVDNDTLGFPNGFLDQQLVQLTVPAGVSAGVIQVITTGGSARIRPVAPVTLAPTLTLAIEVGDTLATAQGLTVNQNSQLTVNGSGLNINVNLDVDLFSFTGTAGDVLTVDVTRLTGTQRLRLFNAAGVELAADSFSGPNSSPRLTNIILPASGIYYVGVSGSNNTAYDPTVVSSGVSGNIGTYTLTIKREDALVSSVTGITAAATSGTPTQGTLPSANTGQTITLTGAVGSFITGDQVVFETVDNSGRLSLTGVITPATIAADGSSLTVVVPANAATGMVRLAREQAGRFLQIVPTL